MKPSETEREIAAAAVEVRRARDTGWTSLEIYIRPGLDASDNTRTPGRTGRSCRHFLGWDDPSRPGEIAGARHSRRAASVW